MYQAPSAPAYAAALYNPNLTASVLTRIAGMAFTVRVLTAISWAAGCGLFGLLMGAAFAVLTMGKDNPASTGVAGFGLLVGAAGGAFIGWMVASMLVVWIEWAGQVLAALDYQAQR